MIDFKKTSANVFNNKEVINLKATIKDQKEHFSVLSSASVAGLYFGSYQLTSPVTDYITTNMGAMPKVAFVMNSMLVGTVLAGAAYSYTQIPNKQDAKIETRNPVSVIEEDKLEEDTQAFSNICEQAMDSDHLYLSATSGSGKTTWANYCLNNHLPTNSQYICLDAKREGKIGGVGSKWEKAHTIVNDPTKFGVTLENVVKLMLKRQANPEVANTLLFVIIDEATTLDTEAIKHITRLLTMGRSANIRVHMYTQAPSAELNNIKGLTQLFQTIPTLTMYKNEHGQRIIQPAKIISGRLKQLGKGVAIPHLEATWVQDLPYEDDSDTFDFGVVVSETVENTQETLQNTPILPTTTTTTTADDNMLLNFMKLANQNTDTDIDNMDSKFVTQIGTAIIKRNKMNEKLSFRGIQTSAGMKHNDRQNKDIGLIKEFMGVE